MGIYLPNMEMPRNGQMLVIFPDGTSYVCFNGMRERLTQTTAIPVPPHGNLIDYDFCMENFELLHDDDGNPVYAVRMRDINIAPTIIPAEEGE